MGHSISQIIGLQYQTVSQHSRPSDVGHKVLVNLVPEVYFLAIDLVAPPYLFLVHVHERGWLGRRNRASVIWMDVGLWTADPIPYLNQAP